MSTNPTSPLRTIPRSLRDLEEVVQTQTRLLASEPGSFAYRLIVRSLELRQEELLDKELLTPELEPSTNPVIVYAKIAIERLVSESRFFANTLKEAFLHPLSTSAIDKRTGKVVKQVRMGRMAISEQPRQEPEDGPDVQIR